MLTIPNLTERSPQSQTWYIQLATWYLYLGALQGSQISYVQKQVFHLPSFSISANGNLIILIVQDQKRIKIKQTEKRPQTKPFCFIMLMNGTRARESGNALATLGKE